MAKLGAKEIRLRDGRLPVIISQRLILRDITLSDISESYLGWLNDPEVNQFLEVRFAKQTKEMLEEYVQSKLATVDTSKHFGVYVLPREELIGTVTLPVIDLNHMFAELSFVIGQKEFWGEGYASEAVSAVLDYCFYSCNIMKIMSGHYDGHSGSRNVLLKNGFQQEGCLREKYCNVAGLRVDHVLYGVTATDFFKKREEVQVTPPSIIRE